MLTIGAMTLLLTIVLNTFTGLNASDTVQLKAKCGLAAVSLAEMVLEDASGQAFDVHTTNDTLQTSTSKLTPAASLGPESRDTSKMYLGTNNFDDFDDYNGLVYKLYNELPDTFYVGCTVTYYNPGSPKVIPSTQTFDKILTVKVSSPHLSPDTIKLQYVFSYFFFN
jgi:hypothetical protein